MCPSRIVEIDDASSLWRTSVIKSDASRLIPISRETWIVFAALGVVGLTLAFVRRMRSLPVAGAGLVALAGSGNPDTHSLNRQ